MKIVLNEVGKKFEREWIFKNLSLELNSSDKFVIKGGNGSGKSTLLQILLGKSVPTKGSIQFSINGNNINQDRIYQYTTIASPYLELIEEFTLLEMINTHFSTKNIHPNTELKTLPKLLYLEGSEHKLIEQFSSGMKQRVKLALAILTDSPILLLDEPISNLDKKGILWYQSLLKDFSQNRIVIVASNEKKEEYPFDHEEINIENFK